MEILLGKRKIVDCDTHSFSIKQLLVLVSEKLKLEMDEFYLMFNGRRVSNESSISDGIIYVILKVPGGKGGFGSMLRAIGAQIEKTTNREACRDLSGRRLRDINEEQRLKKWVAEQANREKESKERKKKKLEKLLEKPKHTFVDQEYDKERSSLPEKVEDAVLKGLEASCSTKRKSDSNTSKIIKKKPKLWVDSELDDEISSSESESGDEDSKLKVENETSHSSKSSPQLSIIKDTSETSEESNSISTIPADSDLLNKSEPASDSEFKKT